jgi:predicted PurR-regulated permease PerM
MCYVALCHVLCVSIPCILLPMQDAKPPILPPAPPSPPSHSIARLHLWQIQWVRDLMLIAAIFGVVYLGYQIRIVTIPILLALTLAYLFEPLVRWLLARRLCSRRVAAMGIIALSFFLLVVPLVLGAGFAVVQGAKGASEVAATVAKVQKSAAAPEDEALKAEVPKGAWMSIRDFLAERPGRKEPKNFQPLPGQSTPAPTPDAAPTPPVPKPSVTPPVEPSATAPVPPRQTIESGSGGAGDHEGLIAHLAGREEMRELGQRTLDWLSTHAGELSASLGQRVASGGADAARAAYATATTVGSIVLQAILTAIFFYFFSTGWAAVLAFSESFIPEARRGRATYILSKMDHAIAGFVRGRITICAIEACFFTLMYFLAGVPAPLVLGPIVGIIFMVPFMQALGAPVAMVLMWLGGVEGPVFAPHLFESSGGLWWILLAPPAIHIAANVFDDYFLTPTIQGKHTDLAIPTIVFSSIAGGALAGVYGLLLAIPVAACVRILMKEVFWPRLEQWVKGEAKDVLPFGKE